MTFNFNTQGITPQSDSGSSGGGVVINNQDKTISENGSYTADSGYTGLGTVNVDVPVVEPNLITKSISSNGTYSAEDDNADGYAAVYVDVPSSGGGGGSTSETRGFWVVPPAVSQLDEEIANDDVFEELKTSAGVTCSIGLVLPSSASFISIRLSQSRTDMARAIKTSDGSFYNTVGLNKHTFDPTKDIIDPATGRKYRWIIIYSSITGVMGDATRFGYLGNESNGLLLSNIAKYIVSYKNGINYIPSGYTTFLNLDSFRFIEGLPTEDYGSIVQANSNPLKYIPPMSELRATPFGTLDFNSSYNKYNSLNLPYGLQCSGFSNNYIGSARAEVGSELLEAYIILPDANLTLGKGVCWTKENWEYIAENAPNVSGKTLSMGELNISVCGGNDSEIIRTLTGKGWTVN